MHNSIKYKDAMYCYYFKRWFENCPKWRHRWFYWKTIFLHKGPKKNLQDNWLYNVYKTFIIIKDCNETKSYKSLI